MKNDTVSTVSSHRHEILVTECHGRFYLRIPELNLIVDGPDVASAYTELDLARRRLIERHEAIGATLPAPRDTRLRLMLVERIAPFALKAAVVALVGVALLISSAVTVNYVLREPLRHAAQKTVRTAMLQVTAGLEDFARRDLSPDREERLRAALRGVVPVLRPFIEELYPLLPGREGGATSAAPRQGG
mgnify:CR=1 FL=1|jgi:hypothetical protein